MAFRAFYALPAENFATATGQHTNAVYGFLTMLLTMIRQQQPTHVAVAFDLDTPTRRSEEYAEYKAGRSETPQEFYGQIDLIVKVMEALRIPTITLDGFEADDIVATLATLSEDAGWETRVVSGDRDVFQLITDRTLVLYPKKGVSDIPLMDAAAVEEKYKVSPAQYPELAALVGETADNLPGIPGVGPGFAAKWLKEYGDLDGVLANADKITGKKGESLREHMDNVHRNRRLNALVRDLELPVTLEATTLEQPDREQLEELFDALEFNRVRQRVFDTFDERLGTTTEPAQDDVTPDFTVADSAQQVNDFLAEHGGELLGVYAEITGPEMVAKRKIPVPGDYGTVTGVSFAADDAGLFVDLTSDSAAAKAARDALADPALDTAVYDVKSIIKAFGSTASIDGVQDDALISAYILQPDRRSYELSALVEGYLNANLDTGETPAAGQQALDLDGAEEESKAQQRAHDAVRAAWMIRRLSQVFTPAVIERGAQQLLQNLEIPLAVVLAELEFAGVAIDEARLGELLQQFSDEADAAQESAWAANDGEKVNLGSPKQLQVVLFEKMDMPKTRKTKTGYSTDVDSLNDLLERTGHAFLQNLMLYRDATKLKQTVQGLKDAVAEDHRIHTTFSQTTAATGRLSSLNPNLQNIPVRTEAGRQIRDVFTAGTLPTGEQTQLLTADYSQIEMRIMAHLSEDEGLITAFKDGEDLHRFVGANVFDVDPQDVTSEMRSKVKAMSYGLAYGLSSFGLSKQLRISVDEARELMSAYFDRFGAVQTYLRDVVKQARKDGFTETMLGRRRYLPDLTSDNRQLRDMAERAALNAPIQGSAADIIKLAMLGVQRELTEQQLRSRMILQIHDELILELAPGEEEQAERILTEQMSSAIELRVPLDVQVGRGRSWNDAAH
ncbi:DNA polymerase I [Citricoccus muralis]